MRLVIMVSAAVFLGAPGLGCSQGLIQGECPSPDRERTAVHHVVLAGGNKLTEPYELSELRLHSASHLNSDLGIIIQVRPAGPLRLEWQGPRALTVSYPAESSVEHGPSRASGLTVQHEPDASLVPGAPRTDCSSTPAA